MKYLSLFILILFLSCCEDNNHDLINTDSNEAIDITDSFSRIEFESAKFYILNNGDRETYSNLYNDNPHYEFLYFHVYLNPETQLNSNCDPSISDFNQLVIRDQDNDPQYFHILIIRKGDLKNNKIFYTVPDWAVEERVFLLNIHDEDIEDLKNGVKDYLAIIKKNTKMLIWL